VDQIVGNFQRSGRRRRRHVLAAVATAAAAGITVASVPAAYGSLAGAGRQHRPLAEATAQRGPTAYVATSARVVVPINLRTHQPLKAIKLNVRGLPQDMAVTPNGRTLYVLSAPLPTRAAPVPSGGDVTPISTATDRAGRPIRLRGDLQQILITPNGQTAYVLDAGTGLVPINLRTRRPLPEIKVRNAGLGEAMLPSGKTIYVNAGHGIVPVNLSTRTARKPIVLPKSTMLGYGPVISPTGTTLYDNVTEPVAGPHHQHYFRPGLLAVNTAANTALKPIMVNNFGGLQLAFAAGGATLYWAGNTSVLPVRTATNKPLTQIRLPNSSDSYVIAGSPDASTIYAADQNATGSKSWVVPINAVTNTAGTPISLGPAGWTPWIVAVVSPGSATAGPVIRTDGAPREIVFVP
jgi:hypothetical protein